MQQIQATHDMWPTRDVIWLEYQAYKFVHLCPPDGLIRVAISMAYFEDMLPMAHAGQLQLSDDQDSRNLVDRISPPDSCLCSMSWSLSSYFTCDGLHLQDHLHLLLYFFFYIINLQEKAISNIQSLYQLWCFEQDKAHSLAFHYRREEHQLI